MKEVYSRWLIKFLMNASAAAPARLSAPFPRSPRVTANTRSMRIPASNAAPATAFARLVLPSRNNESAKKEELRPAGDPLRLLRLFFFCRAVCQFAEPQKTLDSPYCNNYNYSMEKANGNALFRKDYKKSYGAALHQPQRKEERQWQL